MAPLNPSIFTTAGGTSTSSKMGELFPSPPPSYHSTGPHYHIHAPPKPSRKPSNSYSPFPPPTTSRLKKEETGYAPFPGPTLSRLQKERKDEEERDYIDATRAVSRYNSTRRKDRRDRRSRKREDASRGHHTRLHNQYGGVVQHVAFEDRIFLHDDYYSSSSSSSSSSSDDDDDDDDDDVFDEYRHHHRRNRSRRRSGNGNVENAGLGCGHHGGASCIHNQIFLPPKMKGNLNIDFRGCGGGGGGGGEEMRQRYYGSGHGQQQQQQQGTVRMGESYPVTAQAGLQGGWGQGPGMGMGMGMGNLVVGHHFHGYPQGYGGRGVLR